MSGKLFHDQICGSGKLIDHHSGKEIGCHVVNFFIDIHTLNILVKEYRESGEQETA